MGMDGGDSLDRGSRDTENGVPDLQQVLGDDGHPAAHQSVEDGKDASRRRVLDREDQETDVAGVERREGVREVQKADALPIGIQVRGRLVTIRMWLTLISDCHGRKG